MWLGAGRIVTREEVVLPASLEGSTELVATAGRLSGAGRFAAARSAAAVANVVASATAAVPHAAASVTAAVRAVVAAAVFAAARSGTAGGLLCTAGCFCGTAGRLAAALRTTTTTVEQAGARVLGGQERQSGNGKQSNDSRLHGEFFLRGNFGEYGVWESLAAAMREIGASDCSSLRGANDFSVRALCRMVTLELSFKLYR